MVLITALACDGPAAQAGLQKGDEVVSIEGTVLAGLTDKVVSEVIDAITQGNKGESVKLTIKRQDVEPFDVQIIRGTVSRPFDCK